MVFSKRQHAVLAQPAELGRHSAAVDGQIIRELLPLRRIYSSFAKALVFAPRQVSTRPNSSSRTLEKRGNFLSTVKYSFIKVTSRWIYNKFLLRLLSYNKTAKSRRKLRTRKARAASKQRPGRRRAKLLIADDCTAYVYENI